MTHRHELFFRSNGKLIISLRRLNFEVDANVWGWDQEAAARSWIELSNHQSMSIMNQGFHQLAGTRQTGSGMALRRYLCQGWHWWLSQYEGCLQWTVRDYAARALTKKTLRQIKPLLWCVCICISMRSHSIPQNESDWSAVEGHCFWTILRDNTQLLR